MEIGEIAKELAVACLSHENFVINFRPQGTEKKHAAEAGERVGEFYVGVWKALEQQALASSKNQKSWKF